MNAIVGSSAARTTKRELLDADVVVVGAGLAGLAAARVIAASGLEPIVLEARDRVGGRVANAPIGDGAVVELGGQWVAHRDARLRALTDEVGLELFAVYDRGAHLLDLGRGPRRYRGSVPRVGPRTLVELARTRWHIDRVARQVPVAAPWEARRAEEHDATTLGDWLDSEMRSRTGRSLLDAAIATLWAEDPHGVNLLSALAFVHMAGNFNRLSATRGGMVQDRFVGGATRLAEALAATLGERVLLGVPAEGIFERSSRVEVQASAVRVRARHAIVALPPGPLLRIAFDPELPACRRRALESLPLGRVVKIAAAYERPFWREHGLSGRAVTVNAPITTTMDNSPPDGQPGVLVMFAPGARASALSELPERERKMTVLRAVEGLFGPEARHPCAYVEKDWTADPWSCGCYFGLPARQAVTRLLRDFDKPTGRIHWAGTETAFSSYGGMDGAIVSGERAAAQVLAKATQSRAVPLPTH